MLKRIWFLSFLGLSFFSFCQTEIFEPGKIYDELPIANSTDSYSLYLPNSYDEKKLAAVVFIFDPSGRGDIGIRVFIDAAEKYGYILACSNTTKNGVVFEKNLASVNLLFDTIIQKFNIDEKQVYTAGFSGGSRLASAIAALSDKIQGVIACGAGLTINKEFKPNKDKDMFSFVGLVGDEDMNYIEMLNTREALNNYGLDNELIIYKDKHKWPPKTQIDRAFAWLELQAYKRNIRTINQLKTKELYDRQNVIADALQKKGKLFRSIIEFESIAHNFESYFTLDSIREKINTIKTSNAYSNELAKRTELLNKEDDIAYLFYTVFLEELKTGSSSDNFRWWKTEIRKIDNIIETSLDADEVKMFKRLRFRQFAITIETSRSFVNNKKYKQALYCDKLLTFFNPEESYWYYRLAKRYANLGKFSQTIANLEKAIDLGFDKKRIENTSDFQKFKTKKRFNNLFE